MRKVKWGTYQARLRNIKFLEQVVGEKEFMLKELVKQLGRANVPLRLPLSRHGLDGDDFITGDDMSFMQLNSIWQEANKK